MRIFATASSCACRAAARLSDAEACAVAQWVGGRRAGAGAAATEAP
jgi:hypothetical protein